MAVGRSARRFVRSASAGEPRCCNLGAGLESSREAGLAAGPAKAVPNLKATIASTLGGPWLGYEPRWPHAAESAGRAQWHTSCSHHGRCGHVGRCSLNKETK